MNATRQKRRHPRTPEQEAAAAPAQQPQHVTIHTPATAAQGITGTEQLLFA